MKIRVAVNGYGNLGRGVLGALSLCPDMELVCVFTRRDPASLGLSVPVIPAAEAPNWADKIDVCILCGGSATDLPKQGPVFAQWFNTVDSFDTHARIPEYFAAMDAALKAAGHLGIISVGWDPGLFSVNRMMTDAILPQGENYTFWGRGVSQGHSDAIRRIPGVKRAVQYTVPVPEAVKNAIVTMPNYFDEYDTTVNFIDEATFDRDHTAMPHGGFVQRTGKTADGSTQMVEYHLTLGSNPAFTGSVLVAYARAIAKLAAKGETGARTVFDIAPGLLSPKDPADLRAHLL